MKAKETLKMLRFERNKQVKQNITTNTKMLLSCKMITSSSQLLATKMK